jgi:hypothetical protein
VKTLLIILIIYFSLVLIGKYIFPYLLRYFMKRITKKFSQTMNNNYNNPSPNKEGEIHIDYSSEKNSKTNSDIGEYVDFEEIK